MTPVNSKVILNLDLEDGANRALVVPYWTYVV